MVELKTNPEATISHWHQLIENLNASSSAFYDSVQGSLAIRCVPDTTISRIEYQEAGLMSAKRTYLHVARGRQVVDVCAAPFGTGFFISSWLAETRVALPVWAKIGFVFVLGLVFLWSFSYFNFFLAPFAFAAVVLGGLWLVYLNREVAKRNEDVVLALPLLGWLYEKIFMANTYYAMDTALMFRDSVHNAVLEAVDGLTKQQGLRMLTESERRPLNRDLFGPTR
jgi:hypothetical protein